MADFSFFLEFRQRLPAFFYVLFRFWPVNLVEIDCLHLQAAQAGFQFHANGFPLEVEADAVAFAHPLFAPGPGAFCKHERLVLSALQGTSDHFLGMPQAVDGGGVDPVDAEVKRAMDGGDGVVIVLRTPGILPVTASDGPRAKANGSQLHAGVAEGPCCQRGCFRALHNFLDAILSDHDGGFRHRKRIEPALERQARIKYR